MKLLVPIILFLSPYALLVQNFHTEFKYDDYLNQVITIQNSYPKGGQKYTAPNSKEFVSVVF